MTRVTTCQIEKYLSSLSHLLTNYGGEDAKQYVQSLATHHGLKVAMTVPEELTVSLAIKSPGTIDTETVAAKVVVPFPRDRYKAWVDEQQGQHLCSECGKPIRVRRRHYWLGIPTPIRSLLKKEP